MRSHVSQKAGVCIERDIAHFATETFFGTLVGLPVVFFDYVLFHGLCVLFRLYVLAASGLWHSFDFGFFGFDGAPFQRCICNSKLNINNNVVTRKSLRSQLRNCGISIGKRLTRAFYVSEPRIQDVCGRN